MVDPENANEIVWGKKVVDELSAVMYAVGLSWPNVLLLCAIP